MAQSGELQAFHKRYADKLSSVETGYLKVMDQLERTLQQIGEMEDGIYEDMRDAEGLERLKNHSDTTIVDLVSFSGDNIAIENYLIVKGLAQTKDQGSQVVRATE